jgi:hypothetical protein
MKTHLSYLVTVALANFQASRGSSPKIENIAVAAS